MRFKAVIGANYGDEGKGRTVDLLCRLYDGQSLVVRHNSGAQAGHTVVVGDKRHVFSHVGSGAFRGAATLLAHKFVVNPILLQQELEELAKLGVRPDLFAAHELRTTHPLDMLLNQLTEMHRGEAGRHGSCGVGFGETIQRYETMEAQGRDPDDYSQIRAYFLDEIAGRGLDFSSDAWSERPQVMRLRDVENDEFNLTKFEKACEVFRNSVYQMQAGEIQAMLEEAGNVVFEGAQGLLLHQDHPNFPHVTRSRTGAEDIVEFLENMSTGPTIPDIEFHYVTRAYVTRHGPGPLPFELKEAPWQLEDETNKDNKWQGHLRYALLDLSETLDRIGDDYGRTCADGRVLLTVNCLDQLPSFPREKLLHEIEDVGQRKVYLGYGPDSIDTKLLPGRARLGPVDL